MELFFANQLLFGEEILNRLHIFAGPWLDTVMATITATGNEIFYLLVIPVLYWCYDKKFASRIGGAFLTCVLVNESVKEYFNNPRPDPSRLSDWHISPESATSHCVPSFLFCWFHIRGCTSPCIFSATCWGGSL